MYMYANMLVVFVKDVACTATQKLKVLFRIHGHELNSSEHKVMSRTCPDM